LITRNEINILRFTKDMKFTNHKKFFNKFAALVIFAVMSTLASNFARAEVVTDLEKVRAEVAKIVPSATTAKITKTSAQNVFEIEFQGAYAYAYIEGDFVLVGDLYDSKKLVNIGTEQTNKKIVDAINKVPTDKMIVYGPEKPKRYITVFTDIDCGYCRRLHNEVPTLNAAGVQVRYLAFPRAGIGSASHNKYVSVWCNDDPQASLTDAKSGKSVATATCQNPIEETYRLGQEIGVRGTPMIVYDDGTISPGYLQASL